MNTPTRRPLRSSLLAVALIAAPFLRAADARSGTATAAAPATPAVAAVPMPVPPEVAIARPSSEEIAQAQQALKTFLDRADPETKRIAAKFPDLIGVRPPRVNPAVVPFLAPNFRAKHAANVERAKQGDIDLLFMGDSITDWWTRAGAPGVENPPMAGRVVYEKYFGAMKVADFGIAGDTTQGVLYRLKDGEGEGFQPKTIMLMIGTNNGASCSSAEIAEGVGAVVLELRKDFPNAKILLLGIFPRANPGDPIRKTVLEVNPIIAKLHDGKHVFYRDIGEKFLQPDGTIAPEIMTDKLHPTQKGYEIWAETVKDQLADLMK